MSTKELTGANDVDPESTKDWPVATLTRAYVPDAIDLSSRMPPPVKQAHGSCVSFSVGYGARGYYSALAMNAKPGAAFSTPSAAFLHSQIFDKSEPCQEGGSNSASAIDYLMRGGLPTSSDVPAEQICSSAIINRPMPPNSFSVIGSNEIFVRTKGKPKATRRHLDIIKQMLAKGDPVVVQFRLFRVSADPNSDATLKFLGANEIYRGSAGANAGPTSGHAMVFVGYDEARQAFRVQNSWSDAWADGGYGWIGYDATLADLTSALTLRTSETPPKPVPARSKRMQVPFPDAPPCSQLVEVRYRPSGPVLDGFVETERDRAILAAAYGPEAAAPVAVRPWPVCEALLTLNEPLSAPSRPKIEFVSGDGAFKVGDVMGFRVTAPNFPAFLYVVYLQADGTVVNLVPRRGPIRAQTSPAAVLTFGDGKSGRQTFRAKPPAGSEAVVAIAARSPLAQLESLETETNGQFRLAVATRAAERGDDSGEDTRTALDDRLYLSLLRSAMAETASPDVLGREVTADVAYVTLSLD